METGVANSLTMFMGVMIKIGSVNPLSQFKSHHYRVPRKANSAAKGAFLSVVLLFAAAILLMGYRLITG